MFDRLTDLRAHAGSRRTSGLDDTRIRRFLTRDPALGQAIAEAHRTHLALRDAGREGVPEDLPEDEDELVAWLQDGWLNFYPYDHVNPYVPLAAKGPWIVTTHGAVIHDVGGYGMLGLGHAPDAILEVLARPYVMANVMTASFAQRRLVERLRREIGRRRGACPYARFVCMNSGSEAVGVALRLSDLHARRRVQAAGGPRRPTRLLALRGAFHGRTGRAADVSDSSLPAYRRHLESFQGRDELRVVTPNDLDDLRNVFAAADREGALVEAMLLEPVMGEGDPGRAVDRAFYDLARSLTRERDAFLVVDSIQAGLRATGALSIVDYPGFEDCDPPDVETWSKALNAGQFPMSVVGCDARAAEGYVHGVHGNTMTTNPRALEVASAVLDAITPTLRDNVRARGAELVARLEALAGELPGVVTAVRGTGLLVSVALDPARLSVLGPRGVEVLCRERGLGVIHGGRNALRFTPHFATTSDEVALVVDIVREALHEALAAPTHRPDARVDAVAGR